MVETFALKDLAAEQVVKLEKIGLCILIFTFFLKVHKTRGKVVMAILDEVRMESKTSDDHCFKDHQTVTVVCFLGYGGRGRGRGGGFKNSFNSGTQSFHFQSSCCLLVK